MYLSLYYKHLTKADMVKETCIVLYLRLALIFGFFLREIYNRLFWLLGIMLM